MAYDDTEVECALLKLKSISNLISVCNDDNDLWFLADLMQEQVAALNLAFYGPRDEKEAA